MTTRSKSEGRIFLNLVICFKFHLTGNCNFVDNISIIHNFNVLNVHIIIATETHRELSNIACKTDYQTNNPMNVEP